MEEKVYTHRIWESSKDTGIDSLDHHHKKFVDVINNLVDIINDDKCGNEVLEIFHKLLYLAETYFIDEELLYQKNNFTDLKNHQEQHKEFILKISEFRKLYKDSEENVCVKMMKYLDIWYKNHILIEDANAASFMKK